MIWAFARYSSVGKIIGVTKERVRQIQNKALAKIRNVMEEGVLRTRTTDEENADAPVRSDAQPTALA